jgi:hypothetical protein
MLQASSATGTSSVGTPTVSTFSHEADMERLEREVGELRAKMERLHRHHEQRFTTSTDASANSTPARISGSTRLEERRRESRRTALRREMRGPRLFMAGAVLTTIAAVLGIANGSMGSAAAHVGQHVAAVGR